MKLKPTIAWRPSSPRSLLANVTYTAPRPTVDIDLPACMADLKNALSLAGTPAANIEGGIFYLPAKLYDHFAPLPSNCVRVAPGIYPWQA